MSFNVHKEVMGIEFRLMIEQIKVSDTYLRRRQKMTVGFTLLNGIERLAQISDATDSDKKETDEYVHGATSPKEMVGALDAFGADAEIAYTPMNICDEYKDCPLVTPDGLCASESFFDESNSEFAGRCGICLPVDVTMSPDEQDRIIDIVHACFDMQSISRHDLQLN